MSILSGYLSTLDEKDPRALLHYRDRWYDTAEFRGDVNRVKALLAHSKIHHGEHVILGQPNSYAYTAIHAAIIEYGAVVVPINPAMPKPELDRIVSRADVAAAFVQPDLVPYFMEEAVIPTLRVVTEVSDAADSPLRMLAFEKHGMTWGRVAQDAVRPWSGENLAPDEEDTAILLFTSGTTGLPKGVALKHRHVMATVRNVIDSHSLTRNDVSYCFLPLFHINAQVIALLSTLVSGGRLVIEEKFSASKFWPTVATHGITWASAVPTVIGILTKGKEETVVPKSLRFIRSASAPLPAYYAHRFETRFGVPVIESYGLTEAASQVCINPLPPGKRKIGSVGLPCGVELKVVDSDEQKVTVGEMGEILIRGENVVDAYAYGNPSPGTFAEGWFHTGDIGYQDEEGYVYITGRNKEMINRAGQKISPREVEEVIGQHPLVKSVAVIGLPDELYGEQVTAYVITETPAASFAELKEDLRALCLRSLSKYKCPAEMYQVQELPVGPTGKIQRHRLREQVMVAGQTK